MQALTLNFTSVSRGERLNLTHDRVVFALAAANSCDALFTYLALTHGVSELNPLLATVIGWSLIWFLFVKLVLVNALILGFGRLARPYTWAKLAFNGATIAYSLVIIYHVINLWPLLHT